MHLGILGLLRLIDKLKGGALQLVVISEYGEELREIRKELTHILNTADGFDNDPPIRTGDVGLVIRLEQKLKVLVNSYNLATPNNMYQNAIDPTSVKEHYRWGPIKYSD